MAFLGRFSDVLGVANKGGVSAVTMGRFGMLLVPAFIILDLIIPAEAQEFPPTTSGGNCTIASEPCKDGLIIPMWLPQGNLSAGDKGARAVVYMLAMVYMFLGVSIVADRFMAAIEVITSKEKEVLIKKADGQTAVVSVRIWNETVSNLTLMALGSSAPEILLAVIEICHNNFVAGDLGPSTIVGSAAFNLFIIIAICVACIPEGEVRRIKHLRVFVITATWSVFAYVWLYIILSVISIGVVDVWEAVLTFLFFPGTVVTAYIADRKILVHKLLSRQYRASSRKGIVVQTEGMNETEMIDGKANHLTEEPIFKGINSEDPNVREFEQHRRDFIEILRELRRKNPNADMKTLEEMAELEAVNRGPKSRAFYRIQATRKLTGGGKVIKKAKIERRASLQDVKVEENEDDGITKVFFDPGHYTVMENVGTFPITVTREGGDLDKTLYVDFTTEDGTANAGSDYLPVEGTLVFQPGETHKQFSITIIDDDIFEEDEHFYVNLGNLRVGDSAGMFESGDVKALAQLVPPFSATVMIMDDDHPGIFHFEDKELTVTENIGELMIKVVRSSGARGSVAIPFHAVDGTAKAGKDYEIISGELYFENDETEQFIKIHIVDDEEYEKTESFAVEMCEPYIIKKSGSGRKQSDKDTSAGMGSVVGDVRIAELGKPRLGEPSRIHIQIKESQEFKSVVDKLLKKANVSLVVGTSSWREQFVDAITVSAGDEEDDDNEETEEKLPSCMDYVMHFLTLFWKVFFALIPPTDYWGGWACFVVSILMIGLLTALIGDLAASFGCTIGLKDAVTAISFVALGTSVPDTFASKVSAINDRYADSSIGNVTGSNAVNVFLGIGIAWSMAAFYHAFNGHKFYVDPGTLAMSVTTFCVMAVVAIFLLILRRRPSIGGELGGPYRQKVVTSMIFVSFWIIYLLMSSMVAYCYIEGF
ncbi:sodium/calcium exchanger 1-like [Littorina saxatilis]|uniref:Calx-beta domain-containing protein n=1 Tax=Littorina saxatilis TaxID=31220 RepID=A0AAN9BDH4_9CAEN